MKTLVAILSVSLALAACGRPDAPVPRTLALALEHSEPGSAITAPADAEDLDPDPTVLRVKLAAAPADYEVDGRIIEGFAYNDQVPGPTLRARVGDTLVVELTNDLDTATTIHWHGVHVPWAMDGAIWEQDPVEPGEIFTYTFELTHPGTYWYHPHFDTARQVDLGLYGALIVEGPAEPEPDVDLVLVVDGWGESQLTRETPPDTPRQWEPSPPVVRWTVNGLVEPTFEFEGGQVVRARILNVSNGGYLNLVGPGLRQIASDQGFLAAPVDRESVLLAPGDRVELEWLVGQAGFSLGAEPTTRHGGATGGEPFSLLHVAVTAPAPAPSGLAWPGDPALPSPDPGRTDRVYTFTGSPRTGAWLINGESFPEVTVAQLAHGTETILEVRNLSPTDHPFHLHGHGFEVLSRDGVPPAWRQMEDTVNVGIRERVRLRLVADNPGKWMLHCHILSHAEGGMMTVLEVLDP
jgi:FtsP/CotA-like multicopper oxidase with cupredoxin domain